MQEPGEINGVQHGVPDWALEGLAQDSIDCIQNLIRYDAPPLPE